MNIIGSAVLLTVDDPASSARFFVSHLGFREVLAAQGMTHLSRDDAATDLVLRKSAGPGARQRNPAARADVAVSFTVTSIHAEYERLRREGARITLPVRKEPWGEWVLQLTDPNGVVVQLVAWIPPAGA
ncbi:glyoxalase [Streptomyces sp. A0642]|uniref:VOC family protein n=1 Tax=Streptomyces sp. A0642 TaxID=2563100 RepID=UPI0010A29A23|nr:VOC family protein [Streptomyces sp. A0642]THA73203.1 glyoxalase [Streptomyces sp. A0642]